MRPKLLGPPRRVAAVAALPGHGPLLARGLDVEPGRKRPVARATQHHGAHVRVAAQLPEDAPELEPHGARKGVELARPVDLHVRDERRRRRHEEMLVGVAGQGGCGGHGFGFESGLSWVEGFVLCS